MLRKSCFVLAATLCGCDSPRSPEVTILDSAGVQVVLNDSVDQVLPWRYETVARYGGDASGPGSFYELDRRQVAVADHGTIYVLDRTAKRVVQIDTSGALRAFAGAQGEGPGEFTRPVGIAVAPNGDAVVLDAGRGRYIRFAPDGSLRDERMASEYGDFAVWADSTVVVVVSEYGSDGYFQALRYEPEGTELARTALVRTTRYRLSSCGGGFNMRAPVIFAPIVVWAVGRNRRLAVNSEAAYTIQIIEDRAVERSVRRRFSPTVATVSAAEAWASANPTRVRSADGSVCVYRPSEVVEKREFADSIPAVAEIIWNGGREMWVGRWTEGFTIRRTDVFDSLGVYRGTVPVDLPFPVGFLPTGDALYVERDALDIERLVVARIVR